DGEAGYSLNVVPPPPVHAQLAKMQSPLASMPTPLLILLAGLLAAPIIYFFGRESSPAPERVPEAKVVVVDPQGAAPTALMRPTQPVASTVGVAVLPRQNEASKTPTEPPVPRPSAADVQLLMKRGQEFIRIGDLASARVAFRRAAQAGD